MLVVSGVLLHAQLLRLHLPVLQPTFTCDRYVLKLQLLHLLLAVASWFWQRRALPDIYPLDFVLSVLSVSNRGLEVHVSTAVPQTATMLCRQALDPNNHYPMLFISANNAGVRVVKG